MQHARRRARNSATPPPAGCLRPPRRVSHVARPRRAHGAPFISDSVAHPPSPPPRRRPGLRCALRPLALEVRRVPSARRGCGRCGPRSARARRRRPPACSGRLSISMRARCPARPRWRVPGRCRSPPTSVAPASTAMSSSMARRRSPNSGAFTAQAFGVPRARSPPAAPAPAPTSSAMISKAAAARQ